MENITVMVVDASTRAHAISEAYERSPNVKKIIVTPGNDFIGWNRKKEVIVAPAVLEKPETILEVAKKYMPDLIDVAQDDAIASGVVDLLEKNGFKVFGPNKEASKIEWSKKWSRDFMKKNNIPHPRYESFNDKEMGKSYLKKVYEESPTAFLFIKASGLCRGKGAIPSRSLQEGIDAIDSMREFGEAGNEFVIEDGLTGEEVSVYAIFDGESYKVIQKVAQDHKTVFTFDKGKNTGGMGAVTPVSLITPKMMKAIEDQTIAPVLKGMKEIGISYKGILYVGLIIDGEKINVIEYNARWGAPEAEVIIPGIKTPMDEIIFAAINGKLKEIKIEEDEKTRVCVVGASNGYPENYDSVKGKEIYGLKNAIEEGVYIFGAGIKVKDGKFYANGGRLFSLVAEGNSIEEARQKALQAMGYIYIEGNNLHFRTDIGWREMERFQKN